MAHCEQDYTALVAFHSSKPVGEINPNLAGAAATIAELGSHGVGAVFVPKDNYTWGEEPHAEGYFTEPTGNAGYPLALQATPREVSIGAGGIQVVRSRITT